jgi:hypothetical protein
MGASEHSELLQKLNQIPSTMKATNAHVKVRLLFSHEGPERAKTCNSTLSALSLTLP